MAEVQVLHRYMDVTYQSNAGAIAEEQIPVRTSCTYSHRHPWLLAIYHPSMDIKKPSEEGLLLKHLLLYYLEEKVCLRT